MSACVVCHTSIKTDKFHPNQKYCKACAPVMKRARSKAWRKKNGREYMRNYMRNYLKAMLFCVMIVPAAAEATWTERKFDAGYEDFSGTIGTRQTIAKPPPYELATRVSDKRWMTLSRFYLKQRGWDSIRIDEDDDSMHMDGRETGAWSIEYGSTGTMAETTLLDAESVYGWKARFGEISEILAGRGMMGDRIATASFNPGAFNLLVTKTRGAIQDDNSYMFLTNDPGANAILTSAKPVTKKEGANLRIPWEWRATRGEVEMAVVNRFDEQEQRWVRGYATAFTAASERFTFTSRNILKGFESMIRTTDTSLAYTIFDNKATTIKLGTRYVDFTEPIKPRTGFTLNASRKFKEPQLRFTFSLDTYKQGTRYGKTVQGGANLMLYGTTLDLRRVMAFTGSSTTTTNSLTLSRREASISVSQSLSTYLLNTSKTSTATLMINPTSHIRANINYSLSQSDNVDFSGKRTITSMKNIGCNLNIKKTSYTAVLNKYSQSHTISRQWGLNERGIGQTFVAGLTFSKTKKAKSVLANFTYNW